MKHIIVSKNKKGVSLPELIAYVALYGVVMSLLASLVFVIIMAARKVNRLSILNRGASIMYREILSQTIALNPDVVEDVQYYGEDMDDDFHLVYDENGNVTNQEYIFHMSVTFIKKYDYAPESGITIGDKTYKEGERYEIPNPKSITYTFHRSTPQRKYDSIDVTYKTGTQTTTSGKIELEYNLEITSVNSDNIYGCIMVDKQNTSNKYVTFNGLLHFDNKTTEFNFIIPVFVAKEKATTQVTPSTTDDTSTGD